ncbi:hypothetical protein EV421DRAFT_1735581 [Armillaria borealis]|uniref:Uncharacterized protein n=1 Tax=Armillaria borealis TaxID=47425 RepID=A0AA39JLC3_9AGAR|nr:hypothetical protein EV421DRAFT_1735581 [Armillaria borealis]
MSTQMDAKIIQYRVRVGAEMLLSGCNGDLLKRISWLNELLFSDKIALVEIVAEHVHIIGSPLRHRLKEKTGPQAVKTPSEDEAGWLLSHTLGDATNSLSVTLATELMQPDSVRSVLNRDYNPADEDNILPRAELWAVGFLKSCDRLHKTPLVAVLQKFAGARIMIVGGKSHNDDIAHATI